MNNLITNTLIFSLLVLCTVIGINILIYKKLNVIKDELCYVYDKLTKLGITLEEQEIVFYNRVSSNGESIKVLVSDEDSIEEFDNADEVEFINKMLLKGANLYDE